MMTFRNLCFALIAYFIVALIFGQILMYGQGDTPELGMRYGLLYAVIGGGIQDMIRYSRLGEFHFSAAFAALIQLIIAVGVFCFLQFRNRKSTEPEREAAIYVASCSVLGVLGVAGMLLHVKMGATDSQAAGVLCLTGAILILGVRKVFVSIRGKRQD
jgi:hypothetical protein